MTEDKRVHEEGEGLASAYRRMMERVRATMEEAGSETLPQIQELIAQAKDKAVELGELSREEAERIGDYLRRDLTDAASYMSETGNALKEWMRFDLDLIEDRLLDMFSLMVDRTREELDRIAAAARESELLHTGEVTAVGTLRCEECGKEIHFKGPGHIPPCPACRGTRFSRPRA